MQLKHILLLTFFVSFNTFAYECKAVAYSEKIPFVKKNAFKNFAKKPRQQLVEALVFDVTSAKKVKVQHTQWLLDYLENTEANSDQQAFFQLIKYSAEVESGKIKTLKLDEVCDIMKKVNDLQK